MFDDILSGWLRLAADRPAVPDPLQDLPRRLVAAPRVLDTVMFVRPAPGQKLTELRRDIYLRTPPLAWVDRALCRPLPSADDPDLPAEGGPDATTAIPLLQYEGRAGGLNGTVARVKSGRRTLALLDRAGNDPAATIAAFALAGLCGLATNAAALVARISSRRSASGEVPAWTTAILPDLCAQLGIADPCEVWHYGGVETLPGVGRFGPADIAAGPAAFGALLCARIGALLETTLPARLHLRPIIWTEAPTIVDVDKVLAPLAAETFVPYGTAEWRAMTPDALERLVWSEPRRRLSARFRVSDRGIAKRCAREGVTQPPRGYWRKIELRQDPRPLLKSLGITPPAWLNFDRPTT